MTSIANEKRKLRKQYLALRKQMSRRMREKYSDQILEHLAGWEPFRDAQTVHCFMTIDRNGEVDTAPILQKLVRDGKRVVIPKSEEKTKELRHYLYRGDEQLKVNKWGIPEPAGGQEVSTDELDLVLVPMIAADRQKNRLGYGLGFYDRFLSRTPALKTGLLFDRFLQDEPLPVEEFDVRMDYLVTEKGVY
jgi:5-formyltetrahydrofolate cyclo-ligase